MVKRLPETVRFREVMLTGFRQVYDEKKTEQFSALTLRLPGGQHYVTFRGTDDTIVGWKEDLNMGYLEVIPSQTRALEYLGRMTRQYPDAKLRIGGHSKGGNLSVYAAVKAPAAVQDRIVRVYNNDGPGFAKPLVGTPEHTRVADRILTVVPQSSVVGQLLEHEQNVEIVRSDAEGMLQHDGFSWQVKGTQFVHLDDFSREGKLVDEALSSWADSLNTQQREALAEALYSVFTATGAKTLSELNEEKLKSASAMLKTYKNLDRESRRMVSEMFKIFFRLGTKNFVLDTQEEGGRELENLRRVHVKDGVAVTRLMYWLKQNVGKIPMTEISVSDKLLALRQEQEHFISPSFNTICAYRANAAMMHYSATPESDAKLEPRDLLLIDSGGQYLEGTTDITRTFALGPVTDEQKKHFTAVLCSMLNLANAKFLQGMTGIGLDILARGPIWDMGIDYRCGTGHGVSYLMSVHEGPNSFRWHKSPTRAEDTVQEPGMVTTDEPGVYIEGSHGIRTENELVCRKLEENEYGQFLGFETITCAPIDLDAVIPEQMSPRQRGWLNDYHAFVRETLLPLMQDDDERAWLRHATRAI